ncbi:YigZ family protein [Ferrimonas lipolytica]|uniref:YigZ family protein n=1 Tax=Ferrimonas lipolytica TaxID=2724191 RepID=A0A6H1UGN4_9GAMM|nr:YigZ family protein [Ferrimonas lipolytica]QIZ78204.1 YigZ family protein [Ferrimonas lipolytica]
MATSFLVPAAPASTEEVIKRSRFITVIEAVSSGAEARAFHARMRAEHPDARHHCLAFNAGPPGCSRDIGCSDDGEPSGSAGRPMLAVVQGADVGQFAAVVIRYSGGIKLGVGGLVRAYAGGVKQALEVLQTKAYVAQISVTLRCDYADMPLLEYLLELHQGKVLEQSFAQQVELILQLPLTQRQPFQQTLADRSSGRLNLDSGD